MGNAARGLSLRFHAVAAALLLAVSSPVLAQTPERFSDLRQDHPAIDESIALLPSSDINGSFNHLSMLLHRGDVETLVAGDGAAGLLPKGWDGQMASALDGLGVALGKGIWSAPPDAQFTILELVSAYGFERNLQLFAGAHEPCGSTMPGAPCVPAGIQAELGQLSSLLGPVMDDVAAWYDDNRGDEPAYAGLAGQGAQPGNFSTRIDELRDHVARLGIESIDD